MKEEWKRIPEFPDYSISSQGRVRNDTYDRPMSLGINQQGIINVAMVKDGKQHRRSVALLVAQAFVPESREAFDTAINLDGDRTNNAADNIAWRPRWFALKYHAQFLEHGRVPRVAAPIQVADTGETFADSLQAAIKYGLLEKEIVLGILNHHFVWPTYQIYCFMQE